MGYYHVVHDFCMWGQVRLEEEDCRWVGVMVAVGLGLELGGGA